MRIRSNDFAPVSKSRLGLWLRSQVTLMPVMPPGPVLHNEAGRGLFGCPWRREAAWHVHKSCSTRGVFAPLCDPILDRVPTYRATQQVAALHEAIEGYADIQFANIAPEATGSS